MREVHAASASGEVTCSYAELVGRDVDLPPSVQTPRAEAARELTYDGRPLRTRRRLLETVVLADGPSTIDGRGLLDSAAHRSRSRRFDKGGAL